VFGEDAVEGGFDVDGCNVVGHEQQLVGVQFLGVFAQQVLGFDQP
jgi:hypothetical protein